jgi:PilZ domain
VNAVGLPHNRSLPIRLLCAGLDSSLLHRLANAVNFFGCWLDAVGSLETASEHLSSNGYEALVLAYSQPDAALRSFLAALRAPGSRDRQLPVLATADARDLGVAGDLIGHGLTRVLERERAPYLLHIVLREVLDVAPRVRVDAQVTLGPAAPLEGLRLTRVGSASLGRTVDLSRSGMLVATSRSDPPGAVLPFELTVPEEGLPLRGWAEVVRHGGGDDAGRGRLGLRIRTFSSDGGRKYQAYLERLGA